MDNILGNSINKYAAAQCASEAPMLRGEKPTMLQSFEQRKADLEEQLRKVNEAIDALKGAPEFERLLNIVQRVY